MQIEAEGIRKTHKTLENKRERERDSLKEKKRKNYLG